MSFAVKAIDHVEVFVGDIEVAAKWYEDVLGLKETMRWEPEPVMIGAGATKLALFRRNSATAPRAGSLRISEGWRRVAWLTDKAGFEAAKEASRVAGNSVWPVRFASTSIPAADLLMARWPNAGTKSTSRISSASSLDPLSRTWLLEESEIPGSQFTDEEQTYSAVRPASPASRMTQSRS